MKSLHPATYDPSTGTFRCTPPGEEPSELAREAVEDLLARASPRAPETRTPVAVFDAATKTLREVSAEELPFHGRMCLVPLETLDDLLALVRGGASTPSSPSEGGQAPLPQRAPPCGSSLETR